MWKLFERLEASILKYGVASLLIVIPLYPKFPLFQIPGSYVSIRLEDFLIAGVALVWLIKELRDRLPFLKDDINRIILAYFIIGFLSLGSAILLTDSVQAHIGLLHTLRRLEYMVGLFIVVSSIKTMKEVKFYMEVLMLTLVLIFIYAIGQKFFLFPVISTMNTEFAKGLALRLHPGARISSTFAGHYDLAAYLVLLLPLITALFISAKKKITKAVLGLVFLLSFLLLLLAASKISFAAYLIAIAFVLWFARRKMFIVPVLGLSIVASFFSPQLADRYTQTFQVALYQIKMIKFTLPWDSQPTIVYFAPEPTATPIPPPPPSGGKPAPVKKIREILTPTPSLPLEKKIVFYGAGDEMPQTEDRSTAIRVKVEWPRALRALAKNPLLGTGYSSITLATDNDYLRSLGEVGILGFLAFGLILFKIGDLGRRVLFVKRPQSFDVILTIGLLGTLIGFMANAIFIDVFEASKVATVFWLLMGILIATVRITLGKSTK